MLTCTVLMSVHRLSVLPIVTGVPNASTDSFIAYNDAYCLYVTAYDQGMVHRVVEVGGAYDDKQPVPKRLCRPCRSSESSIWGQVTDINEVAAQWGG
jgi:hypothetical protein